MISVSDATTRLGDLFDPVAGTIMSGFLTTDTIGTSSTTFTSQATYSWKDTALKFTNQGQKWIEDYAPTLLGPNNYSGAKQCSTPRTFTASAFGFPNPTYAPHVTEIEFTFTGTRFSITHLNLGGNGTYNSITKTYGYGGDIQVYLEYGGRMWRAEEVPMTTLDNSGNIGYRNIVFAAPFHGRVRIHFAQVGFVSILTDGTSIVAKSKPRYFAIADGDSYFESSYALDADNVSGFFSNGIIDFLFEATGFSFARRGQGGTGFFTNGLGLVYDDTIGTESGNLGGLVSLTISGLSRNLSASRYGWMTNAAGNTTTPFVNYPGEDFGQPVGLRPLIYLLNGTWNDASTGGVPSATMEARALQCYQLIQSTDPLCTFVHISPEPFDDTLFSDSGVCGPPRVGDRSDLHFIGQQAAAVQVGHTRYINAYGPDTATGWWTGDGPAPASSASSPLPGSPSTSQQAQLVSIHDGIHCRKEGYRYYANQIARALAEIRIPAVRANGQA